MLLTNQKTINYEKFITLQQGYDYLVFASAKVSIFYNLKTFFQTLTQF